MSLAGLYVLIIEVTKAVPLIHETSNNLQHKRQKEKNPKKLLGAEADPQLPKESKS